MKNLIAYLNFLQEEHLEDVAKESIRISRSMDFPLMKMFAHIPDEQLIQQSMKSTKEFAENLSNGTYAAKTKESFQNWEDDKLPGISKNDIQPTDLVMIFAAQKKAFHQFLPYYTNDISLAVTIINELEELHVESQNAGINLLFKWRKETERALRESEERFRLFIENVKDYSIIMLDNHGMIVSWNKGAERIKGYKTEEILGKHFSVFYTEEGIKNGEPEKNLQLASQNGACENEGWRVRKDASKFFADVILTALYDPQGQLKGFSKITRDITERKNTEEAILQLNKELEAFTYSVSHDLRAPLRAVSGYANIIEEDYENKLDDEGKRLLSVIKYNAEKMGKLIDDLLAFSKLGRKEITLTLEDMNKLVEGVVIDLNKSIAHKAKIKIGKLHNAKVDYGLIHQVFFNLIANAVKYSSKKTKPHVEITSQKTGNEVVYCVKDNGVGFDMKYVSKLFGVFQRLHTSDEFEGTGVGLAIVQRVVLKHNGRLWVTAEPGKGASFYVALPDK